MGHADAQHLRLAKPRYLLGEGYARTFAELMDTTDWDLSAPAPYEKYANCRRNCVTSRPQRRR